MKATDSNLKWAVVHMLVPRSPLHSSLASSVYSHVHYFNDPLPSLSISTDYCSIYKTGLSDVMQSLDSGLSWREELECTLKALAHLLRDEKTISAYEVHLSRLVPVLLYCLTGACGGTVGGGVAECKVTGVCIGDRARERVRLFKKTFAEASTEPYSDLDSR